MAAFRDHSKLASTSAQSLTSVRQASEAHFNCSCGVHLIQE